MYNKTKGESLREVRQLQKEREKKASKTKLKV